MSEERDKFLTGAMGECWHEPVLEIGEEYYCNDNASFKGCDAEVKCCKCGKVLRASRGCIDKCEAIKYGEAGLAYVQKERWSDFSTWEGFGKLWEYAQKQEWWEKFTWQHRSLKDEILIDLIHPNRFADAVYAFLQERQP